MLLTTLFILLQCSWAQLLRKGKGDLIILDGEHGCPPKLILKSGGRHEEDLLLMPTCHHQENKHRATKKIVKIVKHVHVIKKRKRKTKTSITTNTKKKKTSKEYYQLDDDLDQLDDHVDEDDGNELEIHDVDADIDDSPPEAHVMEEEDPVNTNYNLLGANVFANEQHQDAEGGDNVVVNNESVFGDEDTETNMFSPPPPPQPGAN